MVRPQDAIDVEFETVTKAGGGDQSHVRKKPTEKQSIEMVDGEQLAVFGKKSATRKNKPMPLPLFTLVAAVSSMIAFYAAGGHSLFPTSLERMQVASNPSPVTETRPIAAGPLAIEDVSTQIINRGGNNAVSIQAAIHNKSDQIQTVPAVIITIGDEGSPQRLFRINRGETLKQGERLIFTNTIRTGDAAPGKIELSFSE